MTSESAVFVLIAGSTTAWTWLDPAMGIVGEVVIARRASTPMRDTAAVLLDARDPALERDVRELVGQGDARITDLNVWRVGPEAQAAIVSVTGPVDTETVRARLAPVDELAHLTVERR